MFQLFNKSEQRILKMVDYLIKQDYGQVDELAGYLDCSNRTVKEDLKILEKNYSDYLIIEQDGQEIKIQTHPHSNFQDFLRQIMVQSLPFQLLEHLFFHPDEKVENLANDLNTSPSTIYRTFGEINQKLSPYFNFEIKTAPVRTSGEELDIRSFYLNLFYEKYAPLKWPYAEIDRPVLKEFIQLILHALDISLTFDQTLFLKNSVAVAIYRYKQGYLVPKDVLNPDLSQLAIYLFAHPQFVSKKDYFEEGLGLELTAKALIQMFSAFVTEHMTLVSDYIQTHSSQDPAIEDANQFLNDMIDSLKEEFNLQLSEEDQEDLVYWLYNVSLLKQSNLGVTTLITDHLSDILNYLQEFHRPFWDRLYDMATIYNKKFIGIDDEKLLLFNMYSFCINWPNLLGQLAEQFKTIQVLVISFYDEGKARLIADILRAHVSLNVDYKIYDQPFLDIETITAQDCHIIFSDFSLPNIPGRHQIVCDSLPQEENISQLRDLVTDLVHEI